MPENSLPLIPAVRHWEASGGFFEKTQLVSVSFPSASAFDGVENTIAAQLGLEIQNSGVLKLELDPVGKLCGAAEEIIEPGGANESYQLTIQAHGMELRAQSRTGLFRGAQTLRQLMAAEGGTIPCGVISDSPEFGWRGMLLDCGRHFMPVEVIKNTIDQLAYHKFNVLHWHLTEDQGWRLEVPQYPRLAEVAAWRTESDGSRYGGFYSSDEVKEIVAYAAERFITVVPEIELPGHSVAALAAYPELSCTGRPLKVETQWGIFDDVYCAGNEKTFDFLEGVFTHAMALFPSKYIHIGGDECPKERWKNCEKCQQRIAQENLDGEHELQSWFIRRMEKFLISHDRRLVGWDEILEGGLAPAATVQSWRGTRGAIAAAQQGHNAIVSPTSHCYFDYDVATLDLRQVHSFRPRPENLSPDEQKHILGGEMNLWSEYIPHERLNNMLFPRLTAMAECLWKAPEPRDFSEFLNRMNPHLHELEKQGIIAGPADRPLNFSASLNSETGMVEIQLTLDSKLVNSLANQNLELRQRSISSHEVPNFRPDFRVEDMSLPPVLYSDHPVNENLKLSWPPSSSAEDILLVQLFIHGQPYGTPAVIENSRHLALGLEPVLAHPASDRYPGGGPLGLSNGLHGGINFRDKLWSGYEGINLDATIDLGEKTAVEELSIRFYQGATAWIFLPHEVEFQFSDDGKQWQTVASISHQVSPKTQDRTIHTFHVSDLGLETRFVRTIGHSLITCPSWHTGAGRPCWVFADEFIVR
ncbi:MAG: family 20 glycosylhydrolase [bacterium]|nr:family 20 glycosylhydrolase [bacterium]